MQPKVSRPVAPRAHLFGSSLKAILFVARIQTR
jgi:hypothetical protein